MKRFLKFALVGGIGTIINLVIFILGNYWWDYYLLSATLAFGVAATSNYILNNIWVFADRGHKTSKKLYSKFMVVSVISLGINLLVLEMMQSYIMPELLKFSWISHSIYYSAMLLHIANMEKFILVICQAVGIAASMLVNFVGNNFITFKKKKD